MPVLAQIKTEKVSLVDLINGSYVLTAERKAYWLERVSTMTDAQRRDFAEMLLKERADISAAQQKKTSEIKQAVDDFVDGVEKIKTNAVRTLWTKAESIARLNEEAQMRDLLNNMTV